MQNIIELEQKYWQHIALKIFKEKTWHQQIKPISTQDVIQAYEQNKLMPQPFETDYCSGYDFHIQRIAYFMNVSTHKPITFIKEKDTYHIKDGKHRLAAAYLLNKTHIQAILVAA